MKYKELKKILNIEQEYTEHNINFNGQDVVQKVPHCFATCPTCGEVIADFGNAQRVHILKSLETQDLVINYCPKCGQALEIPCLIEGEVVEESA